MHFALSSREFLRKGYFSLFPATRALMATLRNSQESVGDRYLPPEKTMKIRSIVALVGIAISFALPTFAQQKETVDPQLRDALLAVSEKFEEAWNNNDADALAALFTKDAVLIEESGPVYGREAIRKHYADVFQNVHFSDKYNDPKSNGEPVQGKGHWSATVAREDNDWKIRMLTWNLTSAPAATPSPTASPGNQ